MQSTAAARRYARALFSLAREGDVVEAVRRDLTEMAAFFDANPDLQRRLFQPLHPVAQRRAVLQNVCRAGRASPILENFFAFVIDQRRLVDFPAIRDEFTRLADAAAGRVRARVTTGSQLSDDQRARLESALARRTGLQVQLSVDVDPSLLGGAIATVEGLVFDGSLRTQLSQLRATLTHGQRGT